MESKGYGVFITKTLDGGESDIPASLTGFEDLIRSKWRNWEDILEFKTDEEQAHLIAPLFPASAILYAWRDHPSWIPDSVREAGAYEARRPVSAAMTPPVGGPPNPWSNPRQPAPPAVRNNVPTQPVEDEVEQPSLDEDMGPEPVSESLGSDPLVGDTKQRLDTARKELEAATKRRQERANAGK